MASTTGAVSAQARDESLAEYYTRVRARSVELTATLEPEDFVVQTIADVSPAKWHLAHVTWFFERFVLKEHSRGYREFDADFDFLFNSYYFTAGQMHARPRRGLLSRPTIARVLDYRRHVDAAMSDWLAGGVADDIRFLVTLGLNHEQQHQELILTDIKHVLSCNPCLPAMHPGLPRPPGADPGELRFASFAGGIQRIGSEPGSGFCFDNETPRHRVLLNPFRLASRLVTNSEYRDFIRDGGYAEPALWLADGWAAIQSGELERPLYWNDTLDAEFTLGGQRELDAHAPVCHVSYYEADAFARWAGARLPREAEWEVAAAMANVGGNLQESGYWQPAAAAPGSQPQQLYGDVWEWTQTGYAPYPGFEPLAGSLGEYNGKFMISQMVVRGGSCATAADHIRAPYRSFFYPGQRWQYLGVRLARDD
ncbi:MAG: ergothioneine biosynthesis protein EgtB [Pseudomonadota bacterium]